jgi:hypothetical protein
MTLKIAQSSTPGNDALWNWSVWLEGPTRDLDKIKEVTWKLDPSFSEPIQRVKSRDTQFKLSNNGWGEFEIHAEVLREDGKKEQLRHWLRFEQEKPPSASPRMVEPRTKSGPPTVFLSYTRENAKLVGAVVNHLRSSEMKVVLDVDIPPGEDFGRWTMEQIRRCDAVVIFCGEEVTNSQSREIEVAQRAEVRVIPIVFPGRSYKIPENLKKLQAIQIKDQDTEVAASRIARRIQERIAD